MGIHVCKENNVKNMYYKIKEHNSCSLEFNEVKYVYFRVV